jgi:hypothetical protein
MTIMNRCNLVTLSTITVIAMGLSLLSSNALAQQKSLKEQLVGAWTLVLCDVTRNGAQQPYCADPNPNGILILDASGRYAAVLAARGRPKFNATPTSHRSEARAEEYKAAAMGLVANFGTWSVNEADKTLTQHIEGALFPNVEGADAKRTVSLSGDELKLITPASDSARDVSLYRRAK